MKSPGRVFAAIMRPWRDRLSVRLVGVVVALSVLCTFVLTWNRYRAATVALEEQISGVGKTLVDSLAFNCDDKIVTDDLKALEDLADLVLAQKGVRVAYVVIERRDGKVLNMRNAPSDALLARDDAREFTAPVLLRPEGRRLGTCRIGLRTAEWESMLEDRVIALVAQNLAAFGLIAVTMVWLLHHWIGVPLFHLDAAVRRIGDGDLAAPVPEVGSGQLQRLAGALDRMRQRVLETHRSLTEQNVRLREVDQMKDEFIANISHEIRTPLSAILTGAELLPKSSEPEQESALEAVQRNAQHLLCLVNQVLDFSKLQSGNLALEFELVELMPMVDSLVASARAAAAAKDITVRQSIGANAPVRIRTDGLRVRQILLNLIDNAIKFTEQGSVEVVVAARGTGEERELELKITDTGIGVSAERLSRLFTPFTQGDASMTRRYSGTGLGLAISRGLARMLGGDLVMTSEVGHGAQVVLTLPAPESVEGLACAQRTPESAVDASRLTGRVLLVDDAPDNRRLLSVVLRKVGLEVATAENGERGCAAVAEAVREDRPFDLVLMDIQMPVLDGYSAAKRLRGEGYAMPIVALTAHATESDRERCLLSGFDDYATKPISKAQLGELVRRHLPG
ncbi:MAG: ATP-binding protein [Planctomycetota bacterium]